MADSYNEKLVHDDDIDPITRLIGIPQKSFKEFCTENIEAFNVVAPNQEKVKVRNLIIRVILRVSSITQLVP